ncbi:MAG: hypothetical protein MUF64_27100 [Polyangiaceae bacterium]|nr:hypothetical protein [Polyangiaceae bacterium]
MRTWIQVLLVTGVAACSTDEPASNTAPSNTAPSSSAAPTSPAPTSPAPTSSAPIDDPPIKPAPVKSCATLDAPSAPQVVSLASGANFHPYGFIGDPTVVRDADGYRIWMTSSSRDHNCPGAFWQCLTQGFAYATSADGLTFDDKYIKPEHPDTEYTRLVLDPNGVSWAPKGLETTSALRLPDGTWRMYFTGHMGAPDGSPVPFHDAIGVADSKDGLTWTARQEPVFVGENDWEKVCLDPSCSTLAGGVLEPSVLWNDKEKRFEMWYAAVGQPADSFSTYRIGRAVSPDGIKWEREAKPVLDTGPLGSWDEAVVSHVNVVKTSGKYHMFYHASSLADLAVCEGATPPCDGYTPGSVGHATSDDGVTWNRAAAPLIPRSNYTPHAFFVGGPAAVATEDAIELYVFGTATLESASVFNSTIVRYSLACKD